MARAKIFEYDRLCSRLEELMAAFVEQNTRATFATFIINSLLQTEHELALVEEELLSIWATVQEFKERDTLILMFDDFLNDVLKGPTHLHFYMSCQRLIAQVINGDQKKGNAALMRAALTSQHLKIERVSELIPKIFTSSTLLQIFEQQI